MTEIEEDLLDIYNINLSEVLRANNATKIRVFREQDGTQADYIADRVNVVVNNTNQILKIYNG